MKSHHFLPITLSLAMLAGCDGNDVGQDTSRNSSDSTDTTSKNTYVETGDLDEIRAVGQLRFGNVARAELEELPRLRYGAPGAGQLAREFAQRLGLDPVIDQLRDEDEAVRALLEGRVDVIVGRRGQSAQVQAPEGVVYSLPFQVTKGVVVARAGHLPANLNELSGRRISLPAASPFLRAALSLRERISDLAVDTIPDTMGAQSIIEAVASGTIDVTVAEGWVVEAVLNHRTDIRAGFDFGPPVYYRAAVRESSPELLRVVNDFLLQVLPEGGRDPRVFDDLNEIRNRRILRVLTVNGPSTYFVFRGALVGFDYELVERFADQQGVLVQMIVAPTVADLVPWLREGRGDVIAAGLVPTGLSDTVGVAFTNTYHDVHPVVIASDGSDFAAGGDLAGGSIIVRRNSPYLPRLTQMRDSVGFQLVVTETAESTSQLLDKVASGEFDLTVVESHLAEEALARRQDLRVVNRLEDTPGHSWAVRADQPVLLDSLNTYLDREYRGLFYNILRRKYFFPETRTIVEPALEASGRLSPFDDLARRYAGEAGMDWRLFTAQMFQESRFNPEARSSFGAYGLMQMMPRTAEQMGVTDLADPEQQIQAGAQYMIWLSDRLPPGLAIADRMAFTLASYNAGYGHLLDARRVAEREGLDPDRWFGNVERAMLMLSDPDVFNTVPHGYCRGAEPVAYVRRIIDLGQMYVRLASN